MSRCIMIVEDDLELSEILEYNLNRAGFVTRLLADGMSAVEALESSPPDLVLLDVMLPGIDGWEICRRMQHDPRLNRIPVVVFTAKSAREDFDQARKFNLAGFFTKPYATTDVLRHIQKVLGPGTTPAAS